MRQPRFNWLAACVFGVSSLAPTVYANDDFSIRTYVHEGQVQSAVAIRSDLPTQAIRRHVLIIDTSASQVGVVRESSFKLTRLILNSLPADSKIQLLAVDVECDSLTDGFVSSAEAVSGLNKLNMRTPLGTTNLRAALQQVADASSDSIPTSVLMIGDGLTTADRFSEADVARITTQFSQNNVEAHSILTGPRTDAHLPSILANLTGGSVVMNRYGQEDSIAKTVSQSLQTSALQLNTVIANRRPIDPANGDQLFVRNDRHTVLYFDQDLSSASLQLRLESNQELTFRPADAQQGSAVISHMLQRLEQSNGINDSLCGLSALDAADEELTSNYRQTVKAAQILNRQGKTQAAKRIMAQADQMVLRQPQPILAKFQEDPIPLPAPLVEDSQDNTEGVDSFSGASEDDSRLDSTRKQLGLQAQVLTVETNQAIDEATSQAFDNPDNSILILKDILEAVDAARDVGPDVQSELRRRVEGALTSVREQKQRNALRRREIDKRQAIIESQEKLLLEQEEDEQQLNTLIDVVRGQLDRARHGDENGFEDGEETARVALDLEPGNGPATQALVMSEALGQLDKAYRLVNIRNDRFLETLYQVERSHVPFPDEPPILYPPADVWRALSLVRKEEYESFDLRIQAPTEKWLEQMLDKPIPLLDYPGEAPLSDILQQLADHFTATWGDNGGGTGTDFKMTIWPDRSELQTDGIDSLDDVLLNDIQLDGITLRNALELIFEQIEDPTPLTYVIENEVFKVTTQAAADEALVTRVYPVADLVVPPIPPAGGGFGGGGGGGFGGGGFGGGQGGFGGGGFGGQGGGLGGGGFGGGGFGSVPPEAVDVLNAFGDAPISNVNPDAKKK